LDCFCGIIEDKAISDEFSVFVFLEFGGNNVSVLGKLVMEVLVGDSLRELFDV